MPIIQRGIPKTAQPCGVKSVQREKIEATTVVMRGLACCEIKHRRETRAPASSKIGTISRLRGLVLGAGCVCCRDRAFYGDGLSAFGGSWARDTAELRSVVRHRSPCGRSWR